MSNAGRHFDFSAQTIWLLYSLYSGKFACLNFLRFYILLLIWVCGILPSTALASHLAGGELTYQCIGLNSSGLNRYRMTLTLYRDCSSPANVNFDASVTLYAFRVSDGWLMDSLIISSYVADTMALELNDTCAVLPPGICYARARYTGFLDLPDNNFGYDVTWERCCRNNTTINIVNPQANGTTLTVQIPPTALCNNSPVFTGEPGMALCLGLPYTFLNVATDSDGDSLSYHLLTPYLGGSTADPIPVPNPPPYNTINWNAPYSLSNVLGGLPALEVDPVTGVVRANPDVPGQFALCVAVREYRNGVMLSEVRRDYQLNVVMCVADLPPVLGAPDGPEPVTDVMYFYAGMSNCYTFDISDDPQNFIVFTAEGAIFNDPQNPASFNGAGYGNVQGRLCWTPDCAQAGFESLVYISANDNNNCPGPNYTRDTFRIRVIPPPVLSPQLRCVSAESDDAIRLQWITLDTVPGFARYEIFRSSALNPQEISIATLQDSTSKVYTDAAPGLWNEKPVYRIQTYYNCPQNDLALPGNSVQVLAPVVQTAGSSVASEILWDPWQGWPDARFDVFSVPDEEALATGLQGDRFIYQDCDYLGAFRIQTQDPITGCISKSLPTDIVRMFIDPPGGLKGCAASVLPDNSGVEISWLPAAVDPDFRLVVMRKRPGDMDFTSIGFPASDGLAFTDTEGDFDQGPIGYRIAYENPCGTISGISEPFYTTYLEVRADAEGFILSWTPSQILGGIFEYEVLMREDERTQSVWLAKGRVSEMEFPVFRDSEIINSREQYCYRIRTYGGIDACNREIYSNTDCERPDALMNIPTAFTPNGDGVNDLWFVQGYSIEQLQFQVYDRFGELVFEGLEKTAAWDGTRKGQACPEGIYIYTVTAKGHRDEVFQKHGTLMLLR
jgi:gliding motility-associated-like protein